MAHTVCKKCSIMFKRNGKDYCSKCAVEMDSDHDKVMTYIKESPMATVIDIIIDTGVSLKTINLFVEEGFVTYKENKDSISGVELTTKLGKILDSESKFYSRRLKD